MEIDTERLTPGMVLLKDVNSKSGKAIVAKNTELTDIHIEFIQKFLIETVSVTPLRNSKQTKETVENNIHPVRKQKDQLFVNQYEEVVTNYQKLYSTWENNIPIDMYDVRKTFVPLFEKVITQPAKTVIEIIPQKRVNLFFYKSVAISLLAIFLAKELRYERKDWIQIGFAAILGDVGMTKIDYQTRLSNRHDTYQKALEMHPIHSYQMVENITTLTQQAKMAILQHHERLDGSGYPAKATISKIHPYARIIAVSDYFYSNDKSDTEEMIYLLEGQYKKLEEKVINKLIHLLNK